MDAFNYAMALVSIVVGLAISGMAANLHKLIRHRRSVVWDGRTALAAAFTFLVLFSMWFDVWTVRGAPNLLAYPMLLSIIVEFVLLSLMAMAVLPDDPSANEDLQKHYDSQAGTIWGLFTLYQVSYVGHWFYFSLMSPTYSLHRMLIRLPETLVVPVAGLILMLFPRRRALHLVLIPLLVLLWLYMFVDNTIGT